MACQYVILPGGSTAIFCGTRRHQRCVCGRSASLLCDWKMPGGTCDAPICSSCSTSPAPNKDLCTKHAAAFEAWKAAR